MNSEMVEVMVLGITTQGLIDKLLRELEISQS